MSIQARANEDLPLVTFALFAYNQTKYIQTAVAAALAQTYSPLEIIMSDDCSSDTTFDAMRDGVSSYSGPHVVVLRQQGANRGFASHVNDVMALASGELIIMAAGDDVSFSTRTAKIVSHWLASGRPDGIASDVVIIDSDGAPAPSALTWVAKHAHQAERLRRTERLEALASGQKLVLLGCSSAWSRALWNEFGPLDTDVVNEDAVFSFRAALSNGLAFVAEPLVYYRHHTGNVWSSVGPARFEQASEYRDHELLLARRARWELAACRNELRDVQTSLTNNSIDHSTAEALQRGIVTNMSSLIVDADWWEKSIWFRMHRCRSTAENLVIRCLKVLPLGLYAATRCRIARLKRGARQLLPFARSADPDGTGPTAS